MLRDDVRQKIQTAIDGHRIVVFMKGTKHSPQCGYSARAVEVLARSGFEFNDVNVLSDPELREGIKEFSRWPTLPQIFIDGKLVGGSDVLVELDESGELARMLARSELG